MTPVEKSHWRKIFSKDDVDKEKSIKAKAKELMYSTLNLMSQSVVGVYNFVKKGIPDFSILIPTIVAIFGMFSKGISSTKCLVLSCMIFMKQLTNKSTAYLTKFCNVIVNGSRGLYFLSMTLSSNIVYYIHEQLYSKITILFENPFLVFLSLLLNVAFVLVAAGNVLFERYF